MDWASISRERYVINTKYESIPVTRLDEYSFAVVDLAFL